MFITLHEITASGRECKIRIEANAIAIMEPINESRTPSERSKFAQTRLYTGVHGKAVVEVLERVEEIDKLCKRGPFVGPFATVEPEVKTKKISELVPPDDWKESGFGSLGEDWRDNFAKISSASVGNLKPGGDEHLLLMMPRELSSGQQRVADAAMRFAKDVWKASRAGSVNPGKCAQCQPWQRACDGSCNENATDESIANARETR